MQNFFLQRITTGLYVMEARLQDAEVIAVDKYRQDDVRR